MSCIGQNGLLNILLMLKDMSFFRRCALFFKRLVQNEYKILFLRNPNVKFHIDKMRIYKEKELEKKHDSRLE